MWRTRAPIRRQAHLQMTIERIQRGLSANPKRKSSSTYELWYRLENVLDNNMRSSSDLCDHVRYGKLSD